MERETLLIDVEDRVAVITLNRPDRLNAYTARMGAELFSAFRELDGRDDVRAIVVTGAGKHFCAGADLGGGGGTFADDRAWELAAAEEARARPWNLSTPIIAAINGAAVGVGATLPLAWDIRIADTRARLGFVFTRRGISPEAGSSYFLPRLIGLSRAADLLLTGRMVPAAEALAIGLLSRVVEPDELLPTAREIALDIAVNTAPVSVAVTKRLLWRNLVESDPRRAKQLEDELFFWIGKQPDAAEGVTSFLEKREPRWSMGLRDLPDAVADLPDRAARPDPPDRAGGPKRPG
jgi:enoyl-CoA hydratase/carnithine racemase